MSRGKASKCAAMEGAFEGEDAKARGKREMQFKGEDGGRGGGGGYIEGQL